MIEKKVNVIFYVDVDDNTKGNICAIPSDKDMRSSSIIQKVANCIVESGILAQFSGFALNIAKAVCHHGFANLNEYQFGVEETILID